MGRDITKCHPELQQKCAQLIEKCAQKGLNIAVGECYRTVEEQNELYAQGRTKAGNIVTNAKGSDYSSHHQWGTAFDFYRNDGKGAYNDSDGFFSKVGNVGKSLGLEWGGDWTSPVDKPHFQLPYWGSTTAELKRFYGTPEEFKKTWEAEEVEKIYNWTLEVPEWARPTVQKLLDKGYLIGNDKGELGLTYDMLKVLVINDRARLYDLK